MKNIVVFAGNECKPERTDYYFPMAYTLGKLLAESGFTVVTGGGPGLMDAVMKGSYENGGHTIGVCLSGGPFPEKSKHIHERYDVELLGPRQEKLISFGEAFIALPGGIGTIYEVCQILAQKRKGELVSTIPMILLSDYFTEFHGMIENMFEEGFVNETFTTFYELAETPAQAVSLLKKSS